MHEHELRCCQSVLRPYASVKDVLVNDPGSLFHDATRAAVTHAHDLVTTLKATFAGHEVDRDVTIDVTSVDLSGRPPSAQLLPAVALSFAWHATSARSLFPSMRAELTVYPLSPEDTQLDLHGWYTPPGGAFGDVADALAGHRIAEATVQRFLDDIVERLAPTGAA